MAVQAGVEEKGQERVESSQVKHSRPSQSTATVREEGQGRFWFGLACFVLRCIRRVRLRVEMQRLA